MNPATLKRPSFRQHETQRPTRQPDQRGHLILRYESSRWGKRCNSGGEQPRSFQIALNRRRIVESPRPERSLLSFLVSHRISSHFLVFHCISSYFIVFHWISLYFIVFRRISSYFTAFHCISSYLTVCRAISLRFIVFHCIALYFIVFHCISSYFVVF